MTRSDKELLSGGFGGVDDGEEEKLELSEMLLALSVASEEIDVVEDSSGVVNTFEVLSP